MSKKKVLVVGGTGYLGQHLLQGISEILGTPYNVAFTYNSFRPQPLLDAFPSSLAFRVDLKTGFGFHSIPFHNNLARLPDVVVSCAVLSVPVTEDRVDGVSKQFLEDFKEGLQKAKGWSTSFSAYTLSKAPMNAYTRILANKYPSFLVNSIGSDFVKTNITCDIGLRTAAEGA